MNSYQKKHERIVCNVTSIGRNSILQPNDVSFGDGGGLYRSEFQTIEL